MCSGQIAPLYSVQCQTKSGCAKGSHEFEFLPSEAAERTQSRTTARSVRDEQAVNLAEPDGRCSRHATV